LPRRLYCDSCYFIGLINPDEEKHPDCRAVWESARRGDAILFTSFWAFAEVFKAKCEGPAKPLAEAQDRQIEAMLRQPWVQPVVVDERIGTAARRLMRHFPQCKKPSDAVHLATALALNVDEMHTFDKSDLISLSGKVNRADGSPLTICTPYVKEPALPLPIPPAALPRPAQGLLTLEPPDYPDDTDYIIEWVTEADLDALEQGATKA
jgi:predicted nucleic acid-binding protein